MTRIKGWFIKVWRKLLLIFTAGAVISTALAVSSFADTSSYANGQPFVSGEYVFNLAVNPSLSNINYRWSNNDTTGGSGSYAFSTVQYLNSSFPPLAGDYWRFTHSFSDNHGYQINGTVSLPYRNLPYFDNALSYYLKFSMGFSTLSNLGSGWLNATLRFYDNSDVRLGEVYTMSKYASLASFAIQVQVPAFAREVSYMTLTFVGFGSSSSELYISDLYFSTLVWSVYCDSPVISTELENLPLPSAPPELVEGYEAFTNASQYEGSFDQTRDQLLSLGTWDVGVNPSDLDNGFKQALLSINTFYLGWWDNLPKTIRVLIGFFIGCGCIATLAGITVSAIQKRRSD